MTTGTMVPSGYRPFPNIERRNLFQEFLEIPLMCRALGLARRQRLLEVGCGCGVALGPFARLLDPRKLAAIDVDPAVVAEARARAADRGLVAEVRPADVRALPFDEGSFDLVVDFGTCYHIEHAEYALLEVYRVLAPGGLFVYETRAAQLLSHPVRSLHRRIPWRMVPALRLVRHAGLWAARQKKD